VKTDVVDEQLAAVRETVANARRRLLELRAPAGHWVGELSSSALSTATASFALWLAGERGAAGGGHSPAACRDLATGGLAWLAANQNADGGWGDTTRSFSNISTTVLCWAALRAVGGGGDAARALAAAEAWLTRAAGSLEPAALSRAISARYGKDRTFSVPILTMCAAAGVFGTGNDAWRHVPQLPFELAAMPQSWFRFLRLPVVSYALPALIAIGHARHCRRPSRNPAAHLIRTWTSPRTLRTLAGIQPDGGGFLEATPLTSFVVMSLVASGTNGRSVVARGVDFLVRSARPDGSWPIDTDLSTWVTTLSVNALHSGGCLHEQLTQPERDALQRWLLSQQFRRRHPYTGAAPGGWAWTNHSGGVPDADDTAGALIALHNLGPDPAAETPACSGVQWLLGVQNADGGIPTFCRGWGTLPFDRSAPELTAHVIEAWDCWRDRLPPRLRRATERATLRAVRYLAGSQRPDGSWTPLWFGNQSAPDEANLTYGASRVLVSICGTRARQVGPAREVLCEMIERAVGFLLAAQNSDGGWGGAAGVPSSIEETCHAVRGLQASARCSPSSGQSVQLAPDAATRGATWLVRNSARGRTFDPSPIGLYFAKLWYWERLYPVIGVAALDADTTHGTRHVAPGSV
jgi:squalene-hopene/tetraprenyl-beta-curcumene cyclase